MAITTKTRLPYNVLKSWGKAMLEVAVGMDIEAFDAAGGEFGAHPGYMANELYDYTAMLINCVGVANGYANLHDSCAVNNAYEGQHYGLDDCDGEQPKVVIPTNLFNQWVAECNMVNAYFGYDQLTDGFNKFVEFIKVAQV